MSEPGPSRHPAYESPGYFPSAKIRWGLPMATLATGLLFVVVALRDLLDASVSTEWLDLVDLAIGILFYGALLTIVLVSTNRLGSKSLDEDFGFRFRPVDLVIGLLVAIGLIVTTNIIGHTLNSAAHNALSPETSSLAGHPLWYAFGQRLLAILIAPMVEELVNRGLVMRSVRNAILRGGKSRTPTETRQRLAVDTSVIVSALIFMGLHIHTANSLSSAVFLSLATFVAGLALGWIATRTGRLGPGIVAHVANNLFGVLAGR